MSKRKREEDDGSLDGNTRRHNRLRAKFETSVKELTSALRLARGFERQKLGRRQKQASKEPQTLLRLREEVIVLKQLDLEKTARSYLLKTCTKIKRIRESQVFTSVFGACLDHPEAGKSGPEANVLGRLFKSTPVKNAADKAVTLIFKVLELHQGPASSSYHLAGEANVAGGMPDPDDHSEDVEHVNADQTSPPLQEEVDKFASFGSESSHMAASPSIGSTDVEPKSVVDFLPSLAMAIQGKESGGGGGYHPPHRLASVGRESGQVATDDQHERFLKLKSTLEMLDDANILRALEERWQEREAERMQQRPATKERKLKELAARRWAKWRVAW
ncbi:hypothetical protein DV737_g2367, partial [Chaetothyriales sp. CBS 132003]